VDAAQLRPTLFAPFVYVATTLVGGLSVPVLAEAEPLPVVVQYAQAAVPARVNTASSRSVKVTLRPERTAVPGRRR